VCVFPHSERSASSFWSPPRGVLLKIEPTTHRRLRSSTRLEQANLTTPLPTLNPPLLVLNTHLLPTTEQTVPIHSNQSSPLSDAPSEPDLAALATGFRHLTISPPPISSPSSLTKTLSRTLSERTEEMTTYVMPIRGERSAPTFDQNQPNDISRYFRQLEALFARSKIEEETEKKQYATSYVSSEVADSWEAIPDFANKTKTYIDFRDRLYEIYNQVSLRYILSDLDRIIGERQRLGMRSLQDLSEFHLRFNAISAYLMTHNLLSSREQSQSYLRVFDESMQSRIIMRLQIKLPQHHPSLPYDIDEVYDAAKWVLQGVPTTLGMSSSSSSTAAVQVPIASPLNHDSGYIKTEQLGIFLNEFTKTIVDALNANRPRPNVSSYGSNGPVYGPNAPPNTKCMFDGCDRYIRDCPGVEEYIQQGKCRRDVTGKVVLSSGAYVPRNIPGENLRDRIDEWHKRNPNQLAFGVLSGNTTLFHAVVPVPKPINTVPVIPTLPATIEPSSHYQLSAQDRIAALESELFNLRVRHKEGFQPTIKTRTQRAAERERRVEERETAEEQAPIVRSAPPAKITEEVDDPVRHRSATPIIVHNDQPTRLPIGSMPEHPFRNARDATYAPPQPRNVGVPEKMVQPATRSDPAYRTLPAIHDPSIASKVYKRALDSNVTLTCQELLSLSPEVRSQVRDAVSAKRVVKESANPTAIHALQDTEDAVTEEELSYLFPEEEFVLCEEFPIEPVMVLSDELPTPFDEPIIIEDTIDRYYRELPDGEAPDPKRIIVAKESSALRSILPLVDNQLKVESILDPGSQIIAMSEDVCHALSLPYDPTIVLNMQSANGTVDPSLGLARNVPFLIGQLTFYMQVHVISKPAYDILLGRPFDVLTESIVRNFHNEDQTITVKDPNTRRIATIPTISRGPPRILSKKASVFR
jgi:hypothetical protein